MATIDISLPDALRAFIERRVADGGFSTVSEYVRALVRADQLGTRAPRLPERRRRGRPRRRAEARPKEIER
ncbi:MAG TPA: hypothetical protein VFD84_11325 [Candidatus Binatia bacterium]|nr:hypothetical protein [Candidatus Binatia bacterium]